MTKALAALTVVCFAVTALAAQGLQLDQTARATGVAGAFVAQVDDPTAVFFNPGALGLLKKKKGVSLGAATSSNRSFIFQGRAPGIGAGTIGEQSTSLDVVPSAFMTLPFGKNAVFGMGAFSSMRFQSEWESPDAFSGRFLATKSNVDVYDVTPTLGVQVTPAFGVGAGLVYRTSKISVERRLGADLNGTLREVARQTLETDTKSEIGWNAGMLLRPSTRFSLGLAYRSPMTIDYEGVSTLEQVATGDAQFDQLVQATFPFGQNLAIVSQLRTPVIVNAGIAFSPADPLLFEVDVNRAQWKSMKSIAFVFPNNGTLDTIYTLDLQNTTSYRAGMKFTFPTGPVVRFGYSMDKSPQPDATISPFFAALGRNTITAGFGLDWLDVAVAWSTFNERSVTTSIDQFNGDYSGNRWTVVITATK